MNWNDNQELEPWDIPDRPLEPNKNTPSAPSAGAQWTRSFQQNTPARPKRNVPPPRTNPRRDEFQRKLKASVSLANVAAVTYGVLGGLQFLLAALLALLDAADALPPDVFIFYGAESGTLVSGLIAFIALMSLFWLLLALGLWRKSRVMAVIGLVWSVLLLGGVALGFWEGMPQLPFILVVLAVLGVIGSFRYQKMRRLVVAGEPLADRKPHEWVPQSVIGKVGAVALCLFLVGSLALVAAGASQLGGVAALLPETELAARMEEFVSFPVSEEEASADDWDTQAPADGADPAGWAQTPLPGTTLSMPLPSVITLSEDEETSRLYYDGDNYDFSMDVLWMHLGDAVYTEEEAFEALKNTLDGYGEYGDETIVQPVFTGETEDGILYAQLSVEGESGYVYAMRAFLYDDVYGLISYDRYDLDGWSEAFEDAAASCFDGLVPQA